VQIHQYQERCQMYFTTLPFVLNFPAEVPFAFSLQDLAVRLATVVDQRDPRGVRYPLPTLLMIAVLAKLAGCHRVEALADWARLRAADLGTLFGLERPTMPHARTWGRIFAQAIDPTALEQASKPLLGSNLMWRRRRWRCWRTIS
jgi:hypothetical protein